MAKLNFQNFSLHLQTEIIYSKKTDLNKLSIDMTKMAAEPSLLKNLRKLWDPESLELKRACGKKLFKRLTLMEMEKFNTMNSRL